MSLVSRGGCQVSGSHPASGFAFLVALTLEPGPFCAAVWEHRFFQTAGLLLLYLLTVISGSSSKHSRCGIISLKQCIRRSGSFAWKVMPTEQSAVSRQCWPPTGQKPRRRDWHGGREDAAPIATAAPVLRDGASLWGYTSVFTLGSRFKRQLMVPAIVKIVLIGLWGNSELATRKQLT